MIEQKEREGESEQEDDNESEDEIDEQEQKKKKKKKGSDTSHTTGRTLWCQLNYAYFLTRQMRCDDPVYSSMLSDLRTRSTKNIHKHAELLARRTLGSKTADADANCNAFADIPIVTTRNSVRVAINFHKAKVHSAALGLKTLIIMARDMTTKNGVPLDLTTRKRLLHRLDNQTSNLPGMLPLVPNMPMVIKANAATELGICNGTRCFFSRIILHEDEPVVDLKQVPGTRNVHFAKKAPQVIIVNVPNPKFLKFEGLRESTVIDKHGKKTLYREFPIFPSPQTPFTYNTRSDGKQVEVTINRIQFPLVPGYAITGYCAQGQTYERAIIDIRLPEGDHTGPNNPADLYVLLSRMKTLKGLLILRPFQPKALKQRPRKAVYVEMDRLSRLANNIVQQPNPDISSISSSLPSSVLSSSSVSLSTPTPMSISPPTSLSTLLSTVPSQPTPLSTSLQTSLPIVLDNTKCKSRNCVKCKGKKAELEHDPLELSCAQKFANANPSS